MAVTNGWGQGVINNTNGWGKLATNNIGAGSVYENSASGDTVLVAPSAPSFASTQSFSFDGVDDFISFNEVAYSGEFTFSLWVKPGTFSGNDNFLLGDVNSNAHFLRTKSATQIQLKISGSSVTFTESGGNDIVLNTWQHLMITRDASNNVKAFRNGASFGSTGTRSGNFEVNAIGEVYSIGTFNFLGLIDEVGIWTSDQSSNVSSIYSGGVPNNLNDLSTPPTAWYRMGEQANWDGSKWTLIDQGTGSNNAESVNMTESDRETDVPT